MRLTLVALLCLRAAAVHSRTTSSSVTNFETLWTTRVDSAGESETPSTTNTDPVTSVDSNSAINDSFATSSGLSNEGSSTISTILTTLGLQPSPKSSLPKSDTGLSTETSSTTIFLPRSSTSPESVSVSDITTSGQVTVSSSPRSTMNLSSTTGTVSDSPPVVVTDLLSTAVPSSLSTAITLNLTTANTVSTSSDTAVPTARPLSTAATISITSTAPSVPPTYQDPVIYNRTIETLDPILDVLQILLNKIQNATQITGEKRPTSDLDGEEQNQIEDEANRSMLTPLFRVNHHRRLLGLVSGTGKLSDPDQDSGTAMNPPGESSDIHQDKTSLCTSQAPSGNVCHELGGALDSTEEVLEETQEKMQQLDSRILEQLEKTYVDLEQLTATSDENYSHVDSDKATTKIRSVMQRARDAKMGAERVLFDQSWALEEAETTWPTVVATSATVVVMLGANICCCSGL